VRKEGEASAFKGSRESGREKKGKKERLVRDLGRGVRVKLSSGIVLTWE